MTPIITDNQTGILYRKWPAEKQAECIFLLVHGLGAQSARWEFIAGYLKTREISSYAIELKGYGETKDLKGHIDSFDVYYNDIKLLYNIIQKEQPGKKIFILGESMGALLSLLMVIQNPGLFSGVICISPAFVNNMPFSVSMYIKFIISIIFSPKAMIPMPFNSQWITRDVQYQKQLDSDTREIRVASAKTLFNILLAQGKTKKLLNTINIPVLFLVAGIDKLIKGESSRKIFETIANKNKELVYYPDMYHALSIDSGREKVFDDIINWLKK